LDPQRDGAGGPPLREQLTRRLQQAEAQLDAAAIGDALTTARLQHSLGAAYTGLGEPKRAIVLLTSAILTFAEEYGPDDRRTLAPRNQLGLAYQDDGQWSRAIAVFEPTKDRQQALFGPDDAETLSTAANLGSAYVKAGQYEKALPLVTRDLE